MTWAVRGLTPAGEAVAIFDNGHVDWRGVGVDRQQLERFYALIGEEILVTPEGPRITGSDTHATNAYWTVLEAMDEVLDIHGDTPEEPEGGVFESPADLGAPVVDTTEDMDRSFAARKWTPSLHPRWPKGTPKGGKFMTKGEIAAAKKAGGPEALARGGSAPTPSPARPARPTQTAKRAAAAATRLDPEIKGERPKTKPIPLVRDPNSADAVDVGNDVRKAAQLLAEGKAVRLRQTKQVSILLEELGRIAKDAEARGEKAPNYDLCKITVRGTNLFCIESKGIPRVQMPQLKGVPVKGSPADSMKKDKKGEVDLTQAFSKHLQSLGYSYKDRDEYAANLKATQNELNGVKVAGMVGFIRGGGTIPQDAPMLITEEGYVIDGHHRWAAEVGIDAIDNKLSNERKMKVRAFDMDVIELLHEAVRYANAVGIPNAGFGQTNPANT